jgi:hypothetical protein
VLPVTLGSTISCSLPAQTFTSLALAGLIAASTVSAAVSLAAPTIRYLGDTSIKPPSIPVCWYESLAEEGQCWLY